MTDSAARGGIPAPALHVIGAGFGRTGTLSLRAALVRLGFGPCDHMVENHEHLERFAVWHEALRRKTAGEPIDWRPLLTGFQAIVDWPGAYFWRELTAAHPRAKVVLTVRDPERWYDSIETTIFSVLDPVGPGVSHDIIYTRTFNGRLSDRAHCQAVFARHNQAVRETIASDRLLVFDIAEGWQPLCAFLGVPTPADEPFPHLNGTAAFKAEPDYQRFTCAARQCRDAELNVAHTAIAARRRRGALAPGRPRSTSYYSGRAPSNSVHGCDGRLSR